MSVIRIEHGDSRDIVKTMADNSVDSVVTDPPYSLVSIQKRFGKPGSAPAKDRDGLYKRASAGFMGKQWDTGETAFDPAFWAEVLRVLKPGGHLLAFGGTRTYHRLACAIEDAGFEIRDQIGWVYGSGFPKSHNVSVAIDKANGVPARAKAFNMKGRGDRAEEMDANGREFLPPYKAQTDAARQWQGWGTALKPAWEPIVLARKPLIGTVVANILVHGTGAINIDGCRVPLPCGDWLEDGLIGDYDRMDSDAVDSQWGFKRVDRAPGVGRWPANVIHDGSDEVIAAFPDTGKSTGGRIANISKTSTIYGGGKGLGQNITAEAVRGDPGYGDAGSAARFFYCAKASKKDRAGSRHPTVKPIALMAYLCRLVTRPGGLVLDPFAGSGTTGVACQQEGFDAILIEREAEYIEDINRRFAEVSA